MPEAKLNAFCLGNMFRGLQAVLIIRIVSRTGVKLSYSYRADKYDCVCGVMVEMCYFLCLDYNIFAVGAQVNIV